MQGITEAEGGVTEPEAGNMEAEEGVTEAEGGVLEPEARNMEAEEGVTEAGKQKPGIWRLKEGIQNLILKRLWTVKEGLRKLKKLPERWSVWLDIILFINYEAS
ncbi:hypothetical protein R1flu_005098 [Riccia fluitans]|uniref:Ribosomal protein S2 n=1 Tax=Riccia fluitans TaxID=41844 RepID=A0ABD1YS68_9MARC